MNMKLRLMPARNDWANDIGKPRLTIHQRRQRIDKEHRFETARLDLSHLPFDAIRTANIFTKD